MALTNLIITLALIDYTLDNCWVFSHTNCVEETIAATVYFMPHIFKKYKYINGEWLRNNNDSGLHLK